MVCIPTDTSFSFLFGIILGVVFGVLFGIILGVVFGVIFGIILGIIFGVILGILLGIIFGIILGVILGIVFGIIFGILLGVIFGIVFGILFVFIKTYLSFDFCIFLTQVTCVILHVEFFAFMFLNNEVVHITFITAISHMKWVIDVHSTGM